MNTSIKDTLITIVVVSILLAVCFTMQHISKNDLSNSEPSKKSPEFSLENPDESLEMIIKHLKEEHNIIVPIEDVEKVVIINPKLDEN